MTSVCELFDNVFSIGRFRTGDLIVGQLTIEVDKSIMVLGGEH